MLNFKITRKQGRGSYIEIKRGIWKREGNAPLKKKENCNSGYPSLFTESTANEAQEHNPKIESELKKYFSNFP